MKGPFRRIRSGRRPADDPGQQQDPQATLIVPPTAAPPAEPPTAVGAPPAGAPQPTVVAPPAGEPQPTVVAPPAGEPQHTLVAPPPGAALPAGMAPEDVAPTRPSFRDRGRLRRRLRYLRRVRELGFRDLGGLAFDLHRFRRRNDELVLGKLAALDAVDRELRAIERVLDERRDIIELREPGVAACPRCGALHGSDANFCPQCGTQFSGPRAIGEVGGLAAPAEPQPPVSPAQETLPFSGSEQGFTPVSGALAGNPPPVAPPEPPEPPTMVEPGAGEAAVGGEAVASGDAHGAASLAGGEAVASGDANGVAPADAPAGGEAAATGEANGGAGVDQPTQAFPAVGGDGSAVSRERSAE
jgi:ribosomal protein L40E